ncbi:MAG: hypothetical protein WCE75_15100 [Terracidiphilus sp.]
MNRSAIDEEVRRITGSAAFARKGQMKTLLAILARNIDAQTTLKPDRVIRELWGDEAPARESADLATAMNRLRRTLQTYYETEGSDDPVVLTLPRRSSGVSAPARELVWIKAEPRGEALDPPSPEPADPPAALEAPPPAAPVPPTEPSSVSPRGLRIAVAVVAASLMVISLAIYLAMDRRPYAVTLGERALIVSNAEGQELWRKEFPEGFWDEYYKAPMAERSWIGDLNGDGRTELLFVYHSGSDPFVHATQLICYSAAGKELWRWTAGRDLPEMQGSPNGFKTKAFAVLPPEGGSATRIVVSSEHSLQYPHQIAIVDRNGRTLSEYWHSGHLDHLALADLDGDGRKEIVASGISNGYNQATLVALDPNHAGAPPRRRHGPSYSCTTWAQHARNGGCSFPAAT